MKTTYIATKRILLSQVMFYVERGDILSFVGGLQNILTIYRAQKIVKSIPFTQGSLNAMVRTDMILVYVAPPAEPEPVAPAPVESAPLASVTNAGTPVDAPSSGPVELVPLTVEDSVLIVEHSADPVVEPVPEPTTDPVLDEAAPEPEKATEPESTPDPEPAAAAPEETRQPTRQDLAASAQELGLTLNRQELFVRAQELGLNVSPQTGEKKLLRLIREETARRELESVTVTNDQASL